MTQASDFRDLKYELNLVIKQESLAIQSSTFFLTNDTKNY